jgi:E3 ubiquitin-protein ligase BAH
MQLPYRPEYDLSIALLQTSMLMVCIYCSQDGVFAHAVHMTELDLLIKTRSKDYWRQRLREERNEMVKQSKEYWDSQAMLSMGI